MMGQSINLGCHIQLENTCVLCTKSRYADCIIREAIEIEFHSNSMNREGGFCLSKSWKLLIHPLKKCMELPLLDFSR
jgi:hypothetical protein